MPSENEDENKSVWGIRLQILNLWNIQCRPISNNGTTIWPISRNVGYDISWRFGNKLLLLFLYEQVNTSLIACMHAIGCLGWLAGWLEPEKP